MKSTKQAETKILRTHREGLFVRGGGSHTAATPHVLLSEELRHTARWRPQRRPCIAQSRSGPAQFKGAPKTKDKDKDRNKDKDKDKSQDRRLHVIMIRFCDQYSYMPPLFFEYF